MNDATHDLINLYLGYGHVLINHLPLFLLPVGLIQLFYFKRQQNENAIRFTLKFLVFIGVMTLITFLTGDFAEKVVDGFPAVTESLIEAHDSSAELALILVAVMMALSLVQLIFKFETQKKEMLYKVLLFVLLICSLDLFYVGKTGGAVRHSEFRNLKFFSK